MADKIFYIAPANSSRWVEQGKTWDVRYNTVPFDYQTDYNDYYQKRQTNDVEPIQVLSDYVPTLKYYKNCETTPYKTISVTEVATSIIGETFKCYQAEVDYSTFDANNTYIGVFQYTDDDLNIHQWACTPIDLRVSHPDTMLFEYKNTYNDKEIIFTTGILLNLRIDSLLRDYQPKSDRQDYNDQYYNEMVLNGRTYNWQNLQLYSEEKILLPNWIVEKMNIIFTFDNVKIDGQGYAAVAGQEFKMNRPETGRNNDAWQQIDVQQVPNANYGRLTTGENPTGDYVVIKQAKIVKNVGASFSVAGLFTDNMNLIRLAVVNYGLDTFTMLVGTTAGASDIATLLFTGNLKYSKDIGEVFTVATTIYITVPDGVNLKVTFDYNKYDAPTSIPSSNTGGFVKGTIYSYWNETTFADDFDLATGLGQTTDYQDCQLFGYGDLPDLKDKVLTGLDVTIPANLGDNVGSNSLTLSRSELPAEGIPMFSNDVNFSDGDTPTTTSPVARARAHASQALDYEMSRGVAEPTIGLTGKLGDGSPIDIRNSGIFIAYFTKIA